MVQGVVGSLRVNLAANIAEFREGMGAATKELRKFERNADRVGKNLQNIGGKLSLGITAPLALFARQAVKSAGDAEELQAAFDFSFGEMSDRLNEFARTTGDALGRSTQQLQQQAFTFNQLFKTALDPKEAAELSQQFTLLTNDLSSFFNVAEGDALTKLRSGLVGEAEPLRAFGVFLSAAATEAKAFELGLGDANGKLTEQEKILARAAIILEQTKDAQGDLTRTQNSFTNTQRRFNAELEELAVIVGQELLPPLTELLKFLAEGIQRFKALDPSVQSNTIKMAAFAAAVGPGLIALGSLIRLLGFASKGLGIFVTASTAAGAKTSSLRLNLLGATAAFAGLVPVANAAGKAVGDFIAKDQAFIDGLAILRATLPKSLGGLGVSIEEARGALVKFRSEQAATTQATQEQAAATANLRDNSIEALNAQLKLAQATKEAAEPTVGGGVSGVLPGFQDINAEIISSSESVGNFNDELSVTKSLAQDTLTSIKEFETVDTVVNPLEDVNDALRGGSRQIAEAVAGLGSMEDAAKRIGVALLEALAIQPFINSLQRLLTGGGNSGPIGGILGGFFGGFLADGGPATAGRAFVVGEEGPELFVPQTNGDVIANDKLTKIGATTINQTIVARDPNEFRASRRQIVRGIRRDLGIA